MDDTQHEPRVTDDPATGQVDESRAPDGPAAPVARLLANPRRVRRA
ncbi:hypothetical protein OF117_12575 [Geodermatophilus sp. YIM 151500]|nr:hypothetical protein [Geodermatophilus sp. YIM 151500]MCV2490199.1 hypothetical protein [Geodermatophilus sp. YIM 151500]